MFKKFFPLLFIVILLAPFGVQAQEDVTLAAVEVDLWPEFDRPAMLVINRITVSPQVTLPVEMSVRIPARAGTPNAVAARQPNGSLINVPFTQEDDGAWSRLVFQATTPELQIEYYDSMLTRDGPARHFEYTWPGDYAVDAFVIQVQQPTGATDMRISPSLGPGVPAADGMIYYTAEIGSLSNGQAFSIIIDYQKESEDLSMSSAPIEPSGPLDESAAGRTTMISALPWLLGGLGLLLIGGGIIWYWQSGREKARPKRQRQSRHKPASQQRKEESVVAESEHVYCHQCGKRANPGDRFCRACGKELRIS